MCGIVGYVGYRETAKILIEGLKRLEYRGYDSAGIAVFHHGKVEDKNSFPVIVIPENYPSIRVFNV